MERDFLLSWQQFGLEGYWMNMMPGAGAQAGASGGPASQALLTEMVEMLEGCFPGGAQGWLGMYGCCWMAGWLSRVRAAGLRCLKCLLLCQVLHCTAARRV